MLAPTHDGHSKCENVMEMRSACIVHATKALKKCFCSREYSSSINVTCEVVNLHKESPQGLLYENECLWLCCKHCSCDVNLCPHAIFLWNQISVEIC
jgi:hypothetical protein